MSRARSTDNQPSSSQKEGAENRAQTANADRPEHRSEQRVETEGQSGREGDSVTRGEQNEGSFPRREHQNDSDSGVASRPGEGAGTQSRSRQNGDGGEWARAQRHDERDDSDEELARRIADTPKPTDYAGHNPENQEAVREPGVSSGDRAGGRADLSAPMLDAENASRPGAALGGEGAAAPERPVPGKKNAGEKGIYGPQPQSKFRDLKGSGSKKGKGQEKTAVDKAKGEVGKKVGKAAGEAAGGAIGSMIAPGVGTAIGKQVGKAAGGAAGKYAGENGFRDTAKSAVKGVGKAAAPGGSAAMVAKAGKKLLTGGDKKKSGNDGSLLGSDINNNSIGKKPPKSSGGDGSSDGGKGIFGAVAATGGIVVGVTTSVSLLTTATTTSVVGGTTGAILGGAASVAAIAAQCYDSRADIDESGEAGGGGRRIGGAQLGKIIIPTTGVYTSGYGARWGTVHEGMDIANQIGTPIYAAHDGVVVDAGSAQGFGQWVVIQNMETGLVTEYGHIVSYSVNTGDVVAAGDEIAKMGSEGFSTGPHLHFNVRLNGRDSPRINPEPFLRENGLEVPPIGSSMQAGGNGVAINDGAFAGGGQSQAGGNNDGGDGQNGDANSANPGSANTAGSNGSTSGDLSADGKTLDSKQSANARVIVNAAYDAAKSTTGDAAPTGEADHVKVEDWKKVAGGDLKALFTGGMWEANGGRDYADSPNDASDEEIMEVANRVLKNDGWGAWSNLEQAQSFGDGGPAAAPDGFFLDGGKDDGSGTNADGTPRKNDPDGKKAAVVAIMASYTDTELENLNEVGIFNLKNGDTVPEGDRGDVKRASEAYARAIVDRGMMDDDEGVIAEALSANTNADSYKVNLAFARAIVDKILAGDPSRTEYSSSCTCNETSPNEVGNGASSSPTDGGGAQGDMGDAGFDPNGGADDAGPWMKRRQKGDPWDPSYDGSNLPANAGPSGEDANGHYMMGLNNLAKHQRRVISTIVKVGQDKHMSDAAIISAIMTAGMESKWTILGTQDPYFDNSTPPAFETVYCDQVRGSGSHLPTMPEGHSSAAGVFQQLYVGDGWRNRRPGSGPDNSMSACEFMDPANQASTYYEAIFDSMSADEYRSYTSNPNDATAVANLAIKTQKTNASAVHVYEKYHSIGVKFYEAFRNDAKYWPELGGAQASGPTEEQLLNGERFQAGDAAGGGDGSSAVTGGTNRDNPCPPQNGPGSQRSTNGNLVSTEMGERIIEAARRHEGGRYVWGGGNKDGPTGGGFDCSGLVQYAVYQATGVETPRGTAGYMGAVGTVFEEIDHKDAQPGDIYLNSAISHTGIFLRYGDDGIPILFHAYTEGSPIGETRAFDADDQNYHILRIIKKDGGENKEGDEQN